VIPVVYALLPNKAGVTYDRLLNVLTLEHAFKPSTVLVDFEEAAINAFSTMWPDASLHGCLFHLSQNVYRKVVAVGLKQRYGTDADFALKAKMIPALAFVPSVEVESALSILADYLPGELEPVVDYFEDNYVGRMRMRRGNARFPIPLWNCYERVLDNLPRSNSSVEGWNNRFLCLLGCTHANIWKFADALKKEQGLAEVVIEQCRAGVTPRRKKTSLQVDERLRNTVKTWRLNEMSESDVLIYLKAVARNIA
jgi:hypothetical protein